jgi:hypothetical protein
MKVMSHLVLDASMALSWLFPDGVNEGKKMAVWNWWSRQGSNLRPSHCERDALPTELRPHSNRAISQWREHYYELKPGSGKWKEGRGNC